MHSKSVVFFLALYIRLCQRQHLKYLHLFGNVFHTTVVTKSELYIPAACLGYWASLIPFQTALNTKQNCTQGKKNHSFNSIKVSSLGFFSLIILFLFFICSWGKKWFTCDCWSSLHETLLVTEWKEKESREIASRSTTLDCEVRVIKYSILC